MFETSPSGVKCTNYFFIEKPSHLYTHTTIKAFTVHIYTLHLLQHFGTVQEILKYINQQQITKLSGRVQQQQQKKSLGNTEDCLKKKNNSLLVFQKCV